MGLDVRDQISGNIGDTCPELRSIETGNNNGKNTSSICVLVPEGRRYSGRLNLLEDGRPVQA